MANVQATLDKITAWSKRRGFVFPSSEIYGGMANVYDFGPYGTLLKENVRNLWIKHFIQSREDIFLIDSSVIMNPKIWEASGHTASFADVMVEDKVNHKRHRADHLLEEKLEKLDDQKLLALAEALKTNSIFTEEDLIGVNNRKVDGLLPEKMAVVISELKLKSPDGNELTEPKRFNQLFQTEVGIISGEKNKAYLRGEIAQGLFMNFKNILDSMHPKLPFGIGQAGKAFRNEITMGKFTFRTLEFDLMEFEYFFDHETQNWEELFEMWKKEMYDFAMKLGLKPEHLRWRPHEDFERSHYSSRTEDLEYEFTWGFKEMFGLAYRSDYDLRNHQENSGKDLRYVNPDGTKVLPHVVEPTFGLSRLITILIFDAYTEEDLGEGKTRTVLKLTPEIAPVQVAVFPLQKDEALVAQAQEIYQSLKQSGLRVEFDNSGNIGKMYRKQDEVGTPWCVTVDFDSKADNTVTLRNRDTMEQKRVKVEELEDLVTI
ncbi:MAG: glycine--tRNA ligase [Candidatus Doudnabacteria bacterium]|nr:glycine--tRNA ligase [Candidatus Doudnabacteria bacterium]